MNAIITRWKETDMATFKRGALIALLIFFCIVSAAVMGAQLKEIFLLFFEFLGPFFPLLVWYGCWAVSSTLWLATDSKARSEVLDDLVFIRTWAPVVGVAGTVAGLMITFWYLKAVFSGDPNFDLLWNTFSSVVGGCFKAFGSSLGGYITCLFCAHVIKFIKRNDPSLEESA